MDSPYPSPNHRFSPSNVDLLRSFLFPRMRGEDNPNNPDPDVHYLRNDSVLSQSLTEVLHTYPIQNRAHCDKFYFLLLKTQMPRVGAENGIMVEGVTEFWSPEGQAPVGLAEFYGNFTLYSYMQGEHNTGWSMTILDADLNSVMNHGGVALQPEDLELDWRIVTFFPRPHKNALTFNCFDAGELVFFNIDDMPLPRRGGPVRPPPPRCH